MCIDLRQQQTLCLRCQQAAKEKAAQEKDLSDPSLSKLHGGSAAIHMLAPMVSMVITATPMTQLHAPEGRRIDVGEP